MLFGDWYQGKGDSENAEGKIACIVENNVKYHGTYYERFPLSVLMIIWKSMRNIQSLLLRENIHRKSLTYWLIMILPILFFILKIQK